jgi:hypothetical protein
MAHSTRRLRLRISTPHGTRGCSAGGSLPISASSAALTLPCVCGSSRNHHHQAAAKKSPTEPKIGNACRQLTRSSSATTIGWVAAPPSAAAINVSPKALPRSRTGSQRENARERLGSTPASPMPKSQRKVTSDPKPVAAPVAAVMADHQSTMRVRVTRAPKRSASQPLGISKSAYASVKALKT